MLRPAGTSPRRPWHARHPSFALNASSPKTLLLTGGTGLLGSYLIRDLLLDGRSLAVVVRGTRKQSAAARIETIVAHWEETLGKPLPRPVVLEGDITRPLCGLSSESLGWVETHCDELLNNAASLTFRGVDRAGEPWKTNVAGVEQVLALARHAGLSHLHHVSTAYVCGLRSGTVREDDLDVGQEFANDYERTKVEGERLVRTACRSAGGFLESVTIHRPSIIVGDSSTGWTSTYHGFFAALRLGHTLLTRVALGSTSGPALLGLIGISGADTKNFVPVDWVSAVIAHVVQTPQARGRTYHLTHPDPVPMDVVGRVIQEAVETYSRAASPDDPDLCDEEWFAENLRAELDIYRGYLRNDPVFVSEHTTAAAAHLECPPLDRATLLRMARVAIENEFGRRSPYRDAAPARPTPARGTA
jgi:thioester reductase-like protein